MANFFRGVFVTTWKGVEYIYYDTVKIYQCTAVDISLPALDAMYVKDGRNQTNYQQQESRISEIVTPRGFPPLPSTRLDLCRHDLY